MKTYPGRLLQIHREHAVRPVDVDPRADGERRDRAREVTRGLDRHCHAVRLRDVPRRREREGWCTRANAERPTTIQPNCPGWNVEAGVADGLDHHRAASPRSGWMAAIRHGRRSRSTALTIRIQTRGCTRPPTRKPEQHPLDACPDVVADALDVDEREHARPRPRARRGSPAMPRTTGAGACATATGRRARGAAGREATAKRARQGAVNTFSSGRYLRHSG